MATGVTSFQKKARVKALQIPGTKPSLHKNQLLISTGVPSLDSCIGGGVAVGTVLLIEEDHYSTYSRLLLKYFLAEGVLNRHGVFLSSADCPPEQIIKELPCPVLDDPLQQERTHDGSCSPVNSDMKIAWRYQHLPEAQSATVGGSKFGHYYNLSKTMNRDLVEATPKMLVNAHCQLSHGSKTILPLSYQRVLSNIKQCIQEGGYGTDSQNHKNVLRIGLHSLGSPQWGENAGLGANTNSIDPSICRFLYSLRSLLRSAFASCLITVPSHLFHSEAFVKRIHCLSDTVIRLDSFEGSDQEKNPAYKDYHGLLQCVKLPRLNSLTAYMPDTLDLAFKLRRKKFTIERLHLPPDLSDTASRSQEDPVLAQSSSRGCGVAALPGKLDF